jgi:hypothetical protein
MLLSEIMDVNEKTEMKSVRVELCAQCAAKQCHIPPRYPGREIVVYRMKTYKFQKRYL